MGNEQTAAAGVEVQYVFEFEATERELRELLDARVGIFP